MGRGGFSDTDTETFFSKDANTTFCSAFGQEHRRRCFGATQPSRRESGTVPIFVVPQAWTFSSRCFSRAAKVRDYRGVGAHTRMKASIPKRVIGRSIGTRTGSGDVIFTIRTPTEAKLATSLQMNSGVRRNTLRHRWQAQAGSCRY